jgi:hypothetical protein
MDNIPEKPNIKDSADKINKLYSDLNYYDLYGGSVIMFLILLIIMFLNKMVEDYLLKHVN